MQIKQKVILNLEKREKCRLFFISFNSLRHYTFLSNYFPHYKTALLKHSQHVNELIIFTFWEGYKRKLFNMQPHAFPLNGV